MIRVVFPKVMLEYCTYHIDHGPGSRWTSLLSLISDTSDIREVGNDGGATYDWCRPI